MKILATILLVIAIANANSIKRYGWTPGTEKVFRLESQILTGIPDIDKSQYAGFKLKANVRVQSFNDYSLRIQLEDSELVSLNGKIDITEDNRIIGDGGQSSGSQNSLPQEFKQHLENPVLVHLKRGLLESFVVAQDEPIAVTNIKKSLISQLQLDVTGSQRQVEVPQSSARQGKYHKVLEESVQGKCATLYNIIPLTPARVMELERAWYDEETRAQLPPSTKGKEACEDKQYYEIVKTRDLDHCSLRPVFQHVSGAEFSGDVSKSHVGNLMTHMSSSTTYICGDLSEFTIRKILVDDVIVSNPVGYNTEQKETTRSRMMLELIKQDSIPTEIEKPTPARMETSLVYAYPDQKRLENQMQGEVVQQTQALIDTVPVLPQPTLEEAPVSLIPSSLPNDQVIEKVVSVIKSIAQEVLESPESCTSRNDISGKIVKVSKMIQVIGLQELEQIWTQTLEGINEENMKVTKSLLLDAVAMSGTNPATIFVMKKIDAAEICFIKATATIQSAMKSIRTPTQELVNEIFKMVKEWKNDSNMSKKKLITPTLLQLSNLIYKAYINPSTMVSNYPVRIYGVFGSEQSTVVQQYIAFLEQWLDQSEQDPKRFMKPVLVTALGKLGARNTIKPLLKVVQGLKGEETMYRTLAVNSLKRPAIINPTELKPVLLAIINNPAEHADVRIAALSVVPWTQPSIADLQMIAVRSWYDTSNQVSAYARSTFESLLRTEDPQFKTLAMKIKGVIHMLKPMHYGIQFSQNFQMSKFIRYLLGAVTTNLELVQSKDANGPSKVAKGGDLIMEVLGEGIRIKLDSWSVHSQGFENALDNLLYVRELFGDAMKTSPKVLEELQKIASDIQLTPRVLPEYKSFIQSYNLGYEYAIQLTSEQLLKLLAEMTNSDVNTKLSQGISGNFVSASNILFTEVVAPTEIGFPMVARKDLVSVMASKAFVKKENVATGVGMRASLTPVWHVKQQSDSGIVSPFKNDYVGDGVTLSIHTSIPVEAVVKVASGEVAIELKSPQQAIARQRSSEIIHGLVMPYTLRGSYQDVEPMNRAQDIKEIVSGVPLKKLSKQFNGLVKGEFKFESDNEFNDFYSYWEKIRQHSPLCLPATFPLVSSVRKSTFRLEVNPAISELKSVSLKLKLYAKEASYLMKRISNPIDQSIKHEIESIPSLKKAHEMLPQEAPETIIKVEASFKESQATKKFVGYAIAGYNYVSSHHVKSAAAVAGKSEQDANVYGILYEGELKRPKIKARWNKEQVLNQPLELFYNGKIVYGLENDHQSQQKIVMKSKAWKTQIQIQSVQESAEFKKCNEVALAGRRLSPICLKVRHQAGSLDRAEINFEFPQTIYQSTVLSTFEDIIKAKFFNHYNQITTRNAYSPPGHLTLIIDAARAGDLAHVVVEHGSSAYNLTNIRLPHVTQGIIPIRVRNSAGDGIEQLFTNKYAPASCRVDPSVISTFDNKTYQYTINGCEHVLLVDGQQNFPVAVTTRTVSGEQKMVKVLSGQAKVEIVPESSSMKVKLDGLDQVVNPGKTIIKKDPQSNEVIVEIKHYHDGVYHIYAPQQMMHVLTDGKSIEVIAPQVLKNRAAGLCGDLNGEEIADLTSPRKCIMQPKLMAIAYMLNKNGSDPHFAQCNSLPPQDLQQFKQEERECTKEVIVPTPILSIWERSQRMATPILSAHKFEKHMNKICISKEKLKVCGLTQNGESVPNGMENGKTVKYACVSSPSVKAESLKRRAMVGESLGMELNELATSYTKTETCGANGGAPGKGRHCNPDEGEFNNARCHDGQRCIWEMEDSDISVGVCKNANSVNGMQGSYGSGSGRIGHGIEGGYGLELVGGARDGYASGSGIGGEVHSWHTCQGKEGIYIGCYVDDSDRDLKNGPKTYGYNQQSCNTACQAYDFYSLQNNGWCACGDMFSTKPKYLKKPESECGGARGLGGPWRNSVYETCIIQDLCSDSQSWCARADEEDCSVPYIKNNCKRSCNMCEELEGGAGGFGGGSGSEFGSGVQGLPKFERVNGTLCTNVYGNYSKFYDAMKACSSNANCQGIYDNDCKSKRSMYNLDLHLCTSTASYQESEAGCFYQKMPKTTSVNGMGGGYGSEVEDGGNGIEGGYTFGVGEDALGMERRLGMEFGSGAEGPKYFLARNGICPSGYSPLSSETECKALAGQTVSNQVLRRFGGSDCREQWTPAQTCFVFGYVPHFVNRDCGQTSNYKSHQLVCKNQDFHPACCKQIFVKPPIQKPEIGGTYRIYAIVNGRPIYSIRGRQTWFLYYVTGSQQSGVSRWVIDSQIRKLGSVKGYIRHEGNQKCPNEVGKQWTSYWTSHADPNIEVACTAAQPCGSYYRNYCKNRGECYETNGHRTCQCPRGYHGVQCQTKDAVDACAGYQCANGGSCIENNGTPKCNCPNGFSGNHCEKKEQNGRQFVIGPKGSRTCSEGTEIMDEMSCRKACRSLMIPEEEILGNHKCYKDEEGFCYQNGHQHSGASLICRTSEQITRALCPEGWEKCKADCKTYKRFYNCERYCDGACRKPYH